MAEQLYKLSPHRDLQCYFLTPSAIAALSSASENGFTVSGRWRQQFDWAVVEWNRDNVFEHPALRNLPDGDLSGLKLSYLEQRTNCVPLESNLYPTVDWHRLRIWVDNDPQPWFVRWIDHAVAVGSGTPASVTMTLTSLPSPGQNVGLAWLEKNVYHSVASGDTPASVAQQLAASISAIAGANFQAQSNGPSVTVSWQQGSEGWSQLGGANGNRIGIYGFAGGGASVWQDVSKTFSGGTFPATYQIGLDFGSLYGTQSEVFDPAKLVKIPTTNVRKIRWTWAADLEAASFEQREFAVVVSGWTVIGNGRLYTIAGPGSRRIEDTNTGVSYGGEWSQQTGNFSNSKIHLSANAGDSLLIAYREPAPHRLYLGTRLLSPGATIQIAVDGGDAIARSLDLPGEDILVRLPLGTFGPGEHQVSITNLGSSFFFDFLEIAYPTSDLPEFSPQPVITLATDWDTYHSQSLPPERTVWMINKLGFRGRVNHYVGALWFYELVRSGTKYAALSVKLNLLSNISAHANLSIAIDGATTLISHLVLPDDTAATMTVALANLVNLGSNLIWARASGNQLTVTARAMGADGNGIALALDASSNGVSLEGAGVLSGGVYGSPYLLDHSSWSKPLSDTFEAHAAYWRTDLELSPRINRAARDWHRAFFVALKSYGLDGVAAFSTELGNGDPAVEAGMAQRYPDDFAVIVNTPAVQTNFSPASLAYWQQVYLDMAILQTEAGMLPYLQFGEMQWWYFAKPGVGMTFYDQFTAAQFRGQYGRDLPVVVDNPARTDPSYQPLPPGQYAEEGAFLSQLIGNFTASIRAFVRQTFPACRFEVLYPPDTNYTDLNEKINYPVNDWTAANLDCLKTESFTFTGNRNLELSKYSVGVSAQRGFPNRQRSHLIGIGDAWTAWMKECDFAQSQAVESVVLFALDQYCLIGYAQPPFLRQIRSSHQD